MCKHDSAEKKFTFIESTNMPPCVVVEWNLGSGLKLVGFKIFTSHDGRLSVTFPSRSLGAGGERHYVDFVQNVLPFNRNGKNATDGLKDQILFEYAAWLAERDNRG